MDHSKTLLILGEFSRLFNCRYWLEAGTALAAHRDGKILEWEHDIDIGVWYDEIRDIKAIVKYFRSFGYRVEIQKGFPYLDNIIQLRSIESKVLDIDIYLYKKNDEYAYMRWIQKPEGLCSGLKKRILFGLRSFVDPVSPRGNLAARFIPFSFRAGIFDVYLKLHITSSRCRYHRFPLHFFKNLRTVEFYGVSVSIPADTDEFLEYRYGNDWRIPNRSFNQDGLWRSVPARPVLPMSELPPPLFIDPRKFSQNQ